MRGRQFVVFAYLLFFTSNLIYLNVFALHQEMIDANTVFAERFYFPLNTDQDKGTLPEMHMIEEGEDRGLTNVTGLAFFYLFLKRVFNCPYESLPIVSFIVNNIAILLSYHYFVKIGLQLGLNMSHRWLFFLNPALIYFSQLINKEPLSLLVVLAFTYYVGQQQRFKLVTVSLVSILVRMQLGVVGVFSLWLNMRRHYLQNVFFFYVLTSLAGTRLIAGELSEETYGKGFVMLMQVLNQNYYVGSLLLNPIKALLYLYDLFRSFLFIVQPERLVDLYALRDVPFSIALIYFCRPLMIFFFRLKKYANTPLRPLLTVTCVFFLTLLMNPFIHARYLFPISYNLLLIGVFVSLDLKKTAREKRPLQETLLANPA